MDKEFMISYLKKRNYWWETKNIAPSGTENLEDAGIVYSDMAFLAADMNMRIPFVHLNSSLIHHVHS